MMEASGSKVTPPAGQRSFTFIDQKTSKLQKKDLNSVRRHISNEASQRALKGDRRQRYDAVINDIRKKRGQTRGRDKELGKLETAYEEDESSLAQSISDQPLLKLNKDLPGGRIDTLGILSLPAERRRELELMDYMINIIWPAFCEKDGDGTLNPYPRHWLSRSSKSPALLHAFMYSSSSHLGSRLGVNRVVAKLLEEQLFHQAEAVKALREQLENLEDATPGDLADCIMTIACLATNQRQDLKSAEPDRTPFYPPLPGAAWLDVYGAADFSLIHWKALERLVQVSGGLDKLTIFGLPWIISYADLILCTSQLQKPSFPLLDAHGRQCKYKTYGEFGKLPGSLSSNLYSNKERGSGFSVLLKLGFENHHIQPLLDLADYSTILAGYHYGILANPIIPEIANSRNFIQHQLLSMPSASQLLNLQALDKKRMITADNSQLYEACRQTALLYSAMVTFPVPRSDQVRETLLRDLKDIISSINIPVEQEILDLCLWCSILGGIAALEKPELPWYIEQARKMALLLNLSLWREVEATLTSFAWLESACNPGGIQFWSLVIHDES